MKRLYRSQKNRILAGVCGGIGEYFNIDPTLIRILFIILSFGIIPGPLLYFLFWVIIPKKPKL